jgi:protein O-mannosyl-transferase
VKRPSWLLPLTLCLLAIVPHLEALRNQFVYDDRGVITANRAVTRFDLSAIWGGAYWPDIPNSGLYRPVVSTTYALNWALAPDRPAPFIATNILLHALTTLLAFWVVLRLFPQRRGLAAAAAALFAVHPIHVEAVAGIVGRAEIMASLLTLLAYGAWLDAEKSHSAGRRVLPALFWFLAILSKESAVALPALLLAHRLGWIAAPSPSGRLKGTDLAWPAALAAALLLRWNALGSLVGPVAGAIENPLAHIDPLRRALGACGVLAQQVPQILLLSPFSCDYSYAAVSPGTRLYSLGGLLLAALAIGVLLALFRGKRSPEGWGFLFFLAFWFITSNLIVPIGTGRGDRLLYLPILGVFFLIAAGVSRLGSGNARAKWAPFLIALLVARCGIATAVRVRDWHDDVRLWTSAVRVVPTSVKARMNLSMHILKAESPQAARQALDLISPVLTSGSAYGPLLHAEAKARMFLGEKERAKSIFRDALRYGADSAKVLIEMGNIAISEGNGERALARFDAVKRMGTEPEHAEIGRASALSLLGRYAESAAVWSVVAASRPDSVPIRIAYAWNLNAAGRPVEAEEVLRAGLARREDPRIWNTIARTLLGIEGRSHDALAAAERAVQGDPSQENLTTLTRAQIAAGRTAGALVTRARLVNPDSLRQIDRLLQTSR